MRRAVREYGQTIVMVTHDPNAASYADRVVFLDDGRIVDEMAEPTGRAGARPHEALRGLTMSFQSTALIARKSIRARIGRLIAISIAILVGVSFVVGSFVLADSLRQTFDDLFTQISQNVDLQVRASVAFGEDDVDVQRDPIPASLADQIAQVEGVAATEPVAQRYAQLVDAGRRGDHDPGRADARRRLDRRRGAVGPRRSREGTAAVRARPGRHRQGDRRPRGLRASATQIQVITDTGTYPFTITALVGLGDSDGFAGATLAAWDVATAQQVTRRDRPVSTAIDVQVDEGADPATVQPRIEEILPERHRGRDARRHHRGEQAGARLDHQRLRHRPAGVRLRHGVRQRLPHQQRVPDHDRPAAAGAGPDAGRRRHGQAGAPADLHRGARDGASSPPSLGIGGGILVATALISVFNSAGAGFPDTGTVLLPRTVLMAFLVGVGITLLSVIVPGPAGGQDPAGRGDAPRARVRGAQRPAAGRRHDRHGRRRGDVRRRPVRPAGRHASALLGARRRRRPADLPRRGQRLVDRRPAGRPS